MNPDIFSDGRDGSRWPIGGCYGSSELPTLAPRRSWGQIFVKYREETENKQMRQGSGPRFSRWALPNPSVQAGSPLRPNRAASSRPTIFQSARLWMQSGPAITMWAAGLSSSRERNIWSGDEGMRNRPMTSRK